MSILQPVKIHLAMKDGPISRSVQQVLPIASDQLSLVSDPAEADLVIFDEVDQVKEFSENQTYAFLLTPGHNVPALPVNCTTINVLQILPGLAEAINKSREKKTKEL